MGGPELGLLPILHPEFPYLVPPAHQPRLGAGLAEEIHQGHRGVLAPLRAAAHRGWAWGVPGLAAIVAGGWGAGQWKGEPRRGPGRPSRAGGLPSPPRSRQQPWLHGPPAVGSAGPPCGSSSGWRWPGTPAHGGKVQGEGPGRRLRRLWAPCVRPYVCVCVLTAALAGCMRCQVVLGVGGALKGHRSPWASGRTQVRLPGTGGGAHAPGRGHAPSPVDTPSDRHTPPHAPHTDTQSDTNSTPHHYSQTLGTPDHTLTPKCFQSYADHTNTHTQSQLCCSTHF